METTEHNQLDDRVRRLSYLTESMEILDAEYQKLRAEILEEMVEDGVKRLDTQYGRVTCVDKKLYDYSEFPAVLQAAEELASAKAHHAQAVAEAQKEAPYSVLNHITFSRNKAVVPQADPMKKQAVYVASVISKVAAK